MKDIIKKDILNVLKELANILALKDETDTAKIKELSNKVIHNASIFQDEDSISIAILIYSLSKIVERAKGDMGYFIFLEPVKRALQYLQYNTEGNNEDKFRNEIKNIFSQISSIDAKLKMYIEEVIMQAQIRKGCKLCAHGISVERAAKILGISQWELLDYLGKTSLMDRFEEPMSVKIRLSNARKLFS